MRQNQKTGDSSLAIQGRDVTVSQGISYQDARAIALGVFEENFLRLSGKASELASGRVKELVDRYLDELVTKFPDSIESSADPKFQYDLFIAQREYAKSGDSHLLEILVKLLVDSAKEKRKSLADIVLSESIETAGKVTNKQLDFLSVVFLLKCQIFRRPKSLRALKEFLVSQVAPFRNCIPTARFEFLHMEFSGCISLKSIGRMSILEIIKLNYSGLFVRGLSSNKLSLLCGKYRIRKRIFIPCESEPQLHRLPCLDFQEAEEYLCANGVAVEQAREAVSELFIKRIDAEAILIFLRDLPEDFSLLMENWTKFGAGEVELTSVGIGLAQANLKSDSRYECEIEDWTKY